MRCGDLERRDAEWEGLKVWRGGWSDVLGEMGETWVCEGVMRVDRMLRLGGSGVGMDGC